MNTPQKPGRGLRVVVLGATGNIGTGVLRALAGDPAVGSVVGVARRPPAWTPDKTTWVRADIAEEPDLARHFAGADAVVHLAWLFQPSHKPALTWHNNVIGSRRAFDAVAAAGVPALVHASSVAAYSPGPKDDPGVGESWPTHGWPGAAYCREKAYVERMLDIFERDHPGIRVVRLRPGIVLRRESAAQQRRIFAGPLLSRRLVRPGLLPAVPALPGLRFQALHTTDAADAFRLAATGAARGAFNLAAGPVVDADMLAGLLGTRTVRMPGGPVLAAASAAWHLHLVPAPAGLLDAVLHFPVMDTTRAQAELGWSPRRSADDTVTEFLDGLRHGAGGPTPPLTARLRGGGRLREIATGIGRRQ